METVKNKPRDYNYSKQSIQVPGTKRPGATAVYRNAAYPDLVDINTEGVPKTLVEVFETTLAREPDNPCFGVRKLLSVNPLKYDDSYTWMTYREVARRRNHIGSALEFLWQTSRAGGDPKLPCVGIWSINRPEWQLIDLAVQAYAKVSVALYDTSNDDSVAFICNNSETSIVFASASHIFTLFRIKHQLKFLQVIVSLDELPEETLYYAIARAKQCNVEFFTLSQFEFLGAANPRQQTPPTPNQIYTVCFTSGSTGHPKGTLISHGNLVLVVARGIPCLSYPGRFLSYLPLGHIYGRCLEMSMIMHGISVGYFTGDPRRLFQDAQILQPTVMAVVPRILQRIYVSAHSAADVPGLKGFIFRRAVSEKLDILRTTGEVKHSIWDRLVFKEIQVILGGKVHQIICGSAPVAADCVDFIKIAFACNFYEGYAATETTCALTLTLPGDPNASGTVGPPNPICEIKLVDVPSMGYTSDDKPNPRGELCVRGGAVTRGYYKDPEATAKSIDIDGWFHTRDVAEIDSCGRVRIIDRLGNILKLSQGEFVALDNIQSAYSALPVVSQIFIHADSLKSYLVAVVVFEVEYLAKLILAVLKMHVDVDQPAQIDQAANNPSVKSVVLKEFNKHANSASLKGYERVRNIHITTKQFSVENGTLTPTFKIKRT